MTAIADGVAGLAQAPRDVRTRVFAALGLTHAVGFLIPAAAWFLGEKDPLVLNRVPLAVMLSALPVGALLMVHFSQVVDEGGDQVRHHVERGEFGHRQAWRRVHRCEIDTAGCFTSMTFSRCETVKR